MAFPDLVDIRYRVRTILNETTAAFWSDALLNRLIDDANKDAAIKGTCIVHTDSISTVASTRLIPFIGYMVKSVEYLPTSGTKRGLIKITPNMVGHKLITGDTDTSPKFWYQWGKHIGIDPVPDAAYNLEVAIIDFPAGEMSSDTDEPEVPNSFHTLMPYYAVYKALLRAGKYGSSAAVYKEYLYGLSEVCKDYINTIPDGYEDLKIPSRTIQRGV